MCIPGERKVAIKKKKRWIIEGKNNTGSKMLWKFGVYKACFLQEWRFEFDARLISLCGVIAISCFSSLLPPPGLFILHLPRWKTLSFRDAIFLLQDYIKYQTIYPPPSPPPLPAHIECQADMWLAAYWNKGTGTLWPFKHFGSQWSFGLR